MNKVTTKYRYNVYGLNIESEIELDELIPIKKGSRINKFDVRIKKGNIPKDIDEVLEKSDEIHCNEDYIYFKVDNEIKCYLTEGKTVIIEYNEDVDLEKVKKILLGPALGMILIQKNMVAVEGGALEVLDNGIVISGKVGAGKSTLTNLFRKEGYKFLSDDISVIGFDSSKEPIIYSGYPIESKEGFYNGSSKVTSFFELSKYEGTKIKIEEVTGLDKLNVFMRNIYSEYVFRFIKMNPIYFNKCVEICKQIKVYKVSRPYNTYTADKQLEAICETLDCLNSDIV